MSLEIAPWERWFERVPVPISVIDVHGRQVTCNRAYAEFLGYDPDDVAEIDVGRITRPEDEQWTRTYLMRLLSGEIDEFETHKVYVRRDGSEVTGHLHARSVEDEHGDVAALIATITPIDAASPSAESKLPQLLDFTNDTLTIVDVDGNVLDTKGLRTPILGYPTSYWHDRNLIDIVAPDDRDRLLKIRDDVLADPTRELETEIELVAADGSLQTIHVRVLNRLHDPLIGGLVVVTRNVTEYRATLAELARRSDTAEAVADAQTRLLATVSHELRNPLHAVRGIAELLAEEDLPPAAAELARSLVRQLSGLAHVTQDLLDAARLDAGKVAIETAPTDLSALIGDVVALGRAAVGQRPVDVSSRIARGVPEWVVADADRLRQILGNLVGNAVKFTRHGSVQLVVRPDVDESIIFSVIDTGVGVPPDEQPAILEPFTVGSTAGEQRGAGLGLSIVQRLVAAMGGRVALESTVGSGSRFDVRLRLPVAAPPQDEADDDLPLGLTVLVVEDNPVNQQLARNQLERLGLFPIVVTTGEECLALLTDVDAPRVDVVLMDQQLPGMSGVQTTQRIRALGGAVAELPVIGLSASASSSDRDAFVDAGMNDFVAKPASLDDLSSAIAGAIHRSRRTSADDAPVADAPDHAPATSVVDDAALEALADELGGPSIVVELVTTFLDELDPRLEAILAGLAGDDGAARRAAHTLKSSARLLGAHALADACLAIERDGDRSHDLRALGEGTRLALDAWRAAHDRPS